MAKKDKDIRYKKEIDRLSKIFKDLPEEKKTLATNLIERASFMKVQLEDLEDFLKINGWCEMFQQSEKVPPYSRARPEATNYHSLNTNYQKIIKQLESMLPSVNSSSINPIEAFLSD